MTIKTKAQAHAQQLYWIDTRFPAPALHRAHADGSHPASLALAPCSLPHGLALDGAAGKLHWVEADYSGARLMTAPVTLASSTVLASGMSCLRGVAVAGGSLYWTSSIFFFKQKTAYEM